MFKNVVKSRYPRHKLKGIGWITEVDDGTISFIALTGKTPAFRLRPGDIDTIVAAQHKSFGFETTNVIGRGATLASFKAPMGTAVALMDWLATRNVSAVDPAETDQPV